MKRQLVQLGAHLIDVKVFKEEPDVVVPHSSTQMATPSSFQRHIVEPILRQFLQYYLMLSLLRAP